jgi:UDP-glucose 4-epimerase
MKVLITGDKGFVGTATKNQNLDVIGYDIMDGYDIRDAYQLDKVIRERMPDRILHLAAIARFADADKNPKLAFETNVLGTRNVVEACKRHHIPLVYASTGSVYMPIIRPPPITEDFECRGNSVYGCTKYMGELLVKTHTPHIILRYAHLYGQEKRMHGLIGGFMDRIGRGLKPVLYGGKQSNDFTYINDVATANYLALNSPWDKWNQAYNIGTGEELRADEAGAIICKYAGYQGGIELREGRTVDPEHFVYDVKKAEAMLGFKAKYTFAKGLEDMFSKGGE